MLDARYHFQRLDSMRSDRAHFDSQWEEAAARVIPSHRGSFVGQGLDNVLGAQGQKKTEEQIDATASIAAQRFSAVMESLATPQSGVWHRTVATNKRIKSNRAVRIFFDELTELLFDYRYRPIANFVPNSQQAYQSLGAYGNMVIFVDAPDFTPGLRYRNIHIGEVFFAEDHAGIIDTVYRSFYLTARQSIQKFGEAALPARILSAKDEAGKSATKFEFLHCVYPNSDYEPGRIGKEGKKFASVYLTREDGGKVIREGGYNSFPYAIARYTQFSNELYGRGPAQHVLPAIKVLDAQKKVVLKQGHRNVDPVLLAHDDGVLDAFSLRAGAFNKGGVNAEGRPLVHALPVGNIAVGEKMMDMERQIINDAFLITLFQILVDTPQMTATEVLERTREKGLLVAPTAGRLQSEFLGPLIEREIDLLMQQNLMPLLPRALMELGGDYRIEYDSPMARMQRAEKSAGYLRAWGIAVDFAQKTGDPEPLDWFNHDIAMPAIMDNFGSPVAWQRSEEVVIERRANRAQQAQQQQMVDAAPSLAAVAKVAPEMQKMAAEQSQAA